MLRVLEGQPFRRLGGDKDIFPNVRLISATNRPLATLVAQGLFREDLYHRLKVLEMRLPSLRERLEDIEKLAIHFLAYLGTEMGYSQAYFAPEVLQLFMSYAWPGNVRELRNVVERALVLSRGEMILSHHLPREIRENSDPFEVPPSSSSAAFFSHIPPHQPARPWLERPLSTPSAPLVLPTHEQAMAAFPDVTQPSVTQEDLLQGESLLLEHAMTQHIQRVLLLFDGNISRASEALGITRQTLRRKLQNANLLGKE
ncbi:MAG: sigma-54-dependent Fis family transcriptional regulator [Myxococcales bacterium]|nr:sigma-54-dependent Fis family transcriptional regulator [Myxococcales bacterium]MCB9644359.1 sigma-54-dependent Fis family transcriptional regulator [Myxococcales bacterium]